MGIKEVMFYEAVCDNCGKAHEGPDGIEAWSDENGAMEMALGSDWYSSDDGHLYCDDCRWEFDGSQEEGES